MTPETSGTAASDDRALLARVAAGDRSALEQLYRSHAGWITARLMGRCADAEIVDLAVQDTFVAVWNKGAGNDRGTGEVAAWLWGIAARRLIDQLRKRRPTPSDQFPTEATASAERSGPVTVPESRLAANWSAIGMELDAPRRGLVERAMRRVGMPERVSRLLVSTPALRRSWYLATVAAMVFALAAANPDSARENLTVFLMVAPLVPVAGVALAYGPVVDPMCEVSVATPLSGLRLVALRTMAVAGIALPVVALTALMIPPGPLTAGMWLVPSTALSAVCLALTTFVTPRTAAAIVATGWFLVSSGLSRSGGTDLSGFGTATQLTLVVTGVAAVVVTLLRRRRFEVVV